MMNTEARIEVEPITVKPLVTGLVAVRQGDQLILIAPQQLRDVALQIASHVQRVAS